jgi:hypothetical protein
MKRIFPVLLIYLISLLAIYLLLKGLGIANWNYLIAAKIPITAFFIAAVIGGIVALKFTVSKASFRIFLLAYCSLWALRLFILYVGTKTAPIPLGHKTYDLPAILTNYFTFVFRLDTPLPFMFFLVIDYLFAKGKKNTTDLQKPGV